MFRNLIAYADFTTIAMIAICVCKQKLCRICRQLGDITSHADHDSLFGGLRILGICFFIWCFAFVCIITPTFSLAGSTFGWSASIFGCDSIHSLDSSELKDLVSLCLLILLTVVIITSYALIAFQVIKDKREQNRWTLKIESQEKQTVIWVGIFISAAFLVSVLPDVIAFRSSGFKMGWNNLRIRSSFASVYWWLYGTNFILFVTTNSKLRQAYARFLNDLLKKKSPPANLTSQSSTSGQWWPEMKNIK